LLRKSTLVAAFSVSRLRLQFSDSSSCRERYYAIFLRIFRFSATWFLHPCPRPRQSIHPNTNADCSLSTTARVSTLAASPASSARLLDGIMRGNDHYSPFYILPTVQNNAFQVFPLIPLPDSQSRFSSVSASRLSIRPWFFFPPHCSTHRTADFAPRVPLPDQNSLLCHYTTPAGFLTPTEHNPPFSPESSPLSLSGITYIVRLWR
jgi:hypothetical protein